jgi:hypothetical protein
MKYRLKLVSRYETLKEVYKITKNRNKSKYKDVQIIINKIFRLTKNLNNLKNYTSTSARIHYLVNGFSKCPECECNVLNFTSECCSYKCANKLRHKTETSENKLKRVTKAAQSRDYEKAVEKRLLTMSNTIDLFGNNLHKLTSEKAATTMMSTIEENGLSIAQNRSISAAETIGTDGYRIISDKAILSRIEKGFITPIEDRDSFDVYLVAASFKHGFKTKCKKQNDLLKEYGVFNSRNNKNTKGCVRDHLLSRRYGFDNNIATWIISHPANCEIVLHSENIRRAFTNDNLITLDELLERIRNWID